MAKRLARLDASQLCGNPDLLENLADDVGDDLQSHFRCVEEIVEASTHFFARESAAWAYFTKLADEKAATMNFAVNAFGTGFAVPLLASQTKAAREGEDTAGLTAQGCLRQAARLNDAFVRLYSVLNDNAEISAISAPRGATIMHGGSHESIPLSQPLLRASSSLRNSIAKGNKVYPEAGGPIDTGVRNSASLTSVAAGEELEAVSDRMPSAVEGTALAAEGAVSGAGTQRLPPLGPANSFAKLKAQDGGGGGMFGFCAMNQALETLLKSFEHHEIGSVRVTFQQPTSDSGRANSHGAATAASDATALRRHHFQEGWARFVDVVAHELSPPVSEFEKRKCCVAPVRKLTSILGRGPRVMFIGGPLGLMRFRV